MSEGNPFIKGRPHIRATDPHNLYIPVLNERISTRITHETPESDRWRLLVPSPSSVFEAAAVRYEPAYPTSNSRYCRSFFICNAPSLALPFTRLILAIITSLCQATTLLTIMLFSSLLAKFRYHFTLGNIDCQ